MDALVDAVRLLFQWDNFLIFLLGTAIGLVLGVLPSMFLAGYAVALGMTLFMDPVGVVVLMASMLGPCSVGGSVPAILVGIPGEPVNAATVFDGYPMALKGEAGRALGISAMASTLGGIFGIGVLIVLIPFMQRIVFLFGPPEVFLVIIAGLFTIVVAARADMVKGLIAGAAGMAISLIGFTPVGGIYRFSLGSQSYLLNGIPLSPLFIGLFAIAEAVRMAERTGLIQADVGRHALQGVWQGFKDCFKNITCLLRSSVIGTLVGITPGIGGAVSNFLAYVVTQQVAKDKSGFGKGNPLGVIAAESANNAKDGGAMVPVFAFGIPGSTATAIFLGALIAHGFAVGPLFISQHLSIVWLTIIALTLSNVLGALVVITSAPSLNRLVFMPKPYLITLILVFSGVGAYLARNHIFDVFLAVFFGVMGYFMVKLDYPIVPFIIGFILGGQAEKSYMQSMQISGGDYSIFWSSTVSLVIWALFAVLVVVTLRPYLRRRAKGGALQP